YWPAAPKLGHTGGVPVQNAGETRWSTTILVTRASAAPAQASASAAAIAILPFMVFSPLVSSIVVVVVAMVLAVVRAVILPRLAGGQHFRRRQRCGCAGNAARHSVLQEARLFRRGVLAQHEAFLDQIVQRSAHLRVVDGEVAVARLDRLARIARRRAGGLGDRERDVLAGGLAAVVRPHARAQCPAGVGGERHAHV